MSLGYPMIQAYEEAHLEISNDQNKYIIEFPISLLIIKK